MDISRIARIRRIGSTSSAVAVVIVCVVGCSVGPNFKPPGASVAGTWTEAGSGVNSSPADNVKWWKVFKDPALDRLVKDAHKQNLSLQTAGLRVIQARAQLGIAVGSAYPQSQEVSGDYSYNRDPSLPFDHQFTAASVGFSSSWEVDLWGKYGRGIESDRANLLANVAGYQDTIVSLTAEVAQTYITIRTLQQRIVTAKKNIEIQTRSTEITKDLFDKGEQSELDYQQALSTLSSTQATVPALEISLKQAEHALAILLGMPPQKMSGYLSGSSGIPSPPSEIAAGIPSELLTRRPDIRQAEFQAAAQSEQIGVAKSDLYPRIALLGSFSWSATDIGTGSLGDLLNTTTFGGDIGPSATWSVLNFGRIKNNVRVQDAAFQEALTNYQQTVLSATGEVEDAMVAFQRSRVQAAFLKKGVAASQKAVDISTLQYKEGETSFQRVLDSTRTLAQQQDQYIQTVGSISTNVVALYKALGGGWQADGKPRFVPEKVKQEMEERTNWGKLLDDQEGEKKRPKRKLWGRR